MSITVMDVISLLSLLIAIISICGNIIQHFRRKSLMREFDAYVRGSYDIDFMIARCTSRMRKRHDEKYSTDKLLHYFWCELQSITGLVDASRANAVSVAQAHLGFTPTFRHPAFPNQALNEAIVLGQPPEKLHMATVKVDKYVSTPTGSNDLT